MAECSSFSGRELDQQSNGLLSREVSVRVPDGPSFPDRITAVQPPLKRYFWPCASTWCDSSSGSQFAGVNSKRRESTLSRWKKWVRVPSRPPFTSGRSVAANARAWGAGDRRRESDRPDQPFPIRSCSSVNRAPSSEGGGRWCEPSQEHHFRGRSSAAERLPDMQEAEGAIPSVPTIDARVAQTTEHRASNAGDEGETPSASAIFFQGVMSAADGLVRN